MVAEWPPTSGREIDSGAVVAWALYARERYDAAEKRLIDFRAWARQLAAAAGVVIGLEAALMGQLARMGGAWPVPTIAGLVVLLGATAWQLVILGRAVRLGYVGKDSLGPESPVVLADHVTDETTARRMFGTYYAKGSEQAHAIAQHVVVEVGALARALTSSLWLLFAGMLLSAGLMSVSFFSGRVMSDTPATGTTAPAPAPAVPASSQPAQGGSSPLMVTPTPGRVETRSDPIRSILVATPTPGQRLTEGMNPGTGRADQK